MKKSAYYIIAGLILSLLLGMFIGNRLRKSVIQTDTVTIVRVDTLKEIMPPAHDTIYTSKYIRIPITEFDTTYITSVDTAYIIKKEYVQVPESQIHYHTDSLYDCWVSGYAPRLDSIYVYPKTIERTIHTYDKPHNTLSLFADGEFTLIHFNETFVV